MRVSTNQYSQMMSGSLNMNSLGINKLMQQMATGKRLLLPSDDPIASTRVLTLQREQAMIGQYKGNIDQADTLLGKQEAYMSNVTEVLHEVRDLLLWASNDANGPSEREAIASEIATLQDTIVSLVNAKDENGKYLFAGNEVNETPLTKDDDGNWVYNGDRGVREVIVGDGITMKININAGDLFFDDGDDLFNQLEAAVIALQDPDFSAGDGDVLSRSIDILDRTLGNVSGAITELGSRQNSLRTMQDGHEEIGLFNDALIGELEDLDYADAMVQFNHYMLALQATQATYMKTASLNLFSMMG